MNKKRTVIFGGSFDPIHTGHVALAKEVIDKNIADEVWFMVSPLNPHKQDRELTDENQRLQMVEIAVEGERGLSACDFEFKMPRPSYTLHTLEALEREYPERSFSLLIGADNWEKFDKWYKSDEIKARYPIIVYPRGNNNMPLLPKGVKWLTAELHEISSTEIRRNIAAGTFSTIEKWLSPKVLNYIKKNRLYI